jgi:hypothetical protein
MPVRNCEAATAGLLSDGARKVDRYTAYNVPSSGRYIVLAVKAATERDSGDFHFWALNSDGTWSYKAGDTLSRNTFRNGTAIRDIESPEALGGYTDFCGYFEVRAWQPASRLIMIIAAGITESSLANEALMVSPQGRCRGCSRLW